jgi:hypothetical protein
VWIEYRAFVGKYNPKNFVRAVIHRNWLHWKIIVLKFVTVVLYLLIHQISVLILLVLRFCEVRNHRSPRTSAPSTEHDTRILPYPYTRNVPFTPCTTPLPHVLRITSSEHSFDSSCMGRGWGADLKTGLPLQRTSSAWAGGNRKLK